MGIRRKCSTIDDNTIHIPCISGIGWRIAHAEGMLSILTNRESVSTSNGRSIARNIHINVDGGRVGTITVGGRHRVGVSVRTRNYVDSRIRRTSIPFVCCIASQDVADVGIQRHVLAGTNIGGRSDNLKIRTYIIYSERFRSNDATMFGSTNDHIRTSSCIIQHSVGTRDRTKPIVVFNTDGSSSQRGHISVTNNIVARDGEHDRSFHNDGVSIRDSRHTTSGTDGLDLEIVSGRMLERERELSQVFTRNFNAIHIPNIGGCISGGSANRYSRTCANCVFGDSNRGADVFDIGNLNVTR